MNPFMKRAVQLAIDNVKEGGQPFGAVLVKDDQIIAEGINELHFKYDISGHAELVAIRKAQEKLKTHDLSGYEMYASGSPCPMCLTAMYFSGIDTIYYCASIEATAEAGLDASKKIYEDLKKPDADRRVVLQHIPLSEDMPDPMKLWQQKQKNK